VRKMAPSGDVTFIEAAEARRLVGKALYGDDWIGELSSKELKLLTGPNGPQRKRLSNGRTINIIPRCSPSLRNKLDLAWGRGERAYLQLATAIDVLHDHGFIFGDKVFDLDRFKMFLSKISRPNTELQKRSVGKPRVLIEGVVTRMASDMRVGIGIEALKGKELAVKYGVSRNTAVAARREVLEKLARK
jgi:hypothetical protein